MNNDKLYSIKWMFKSFQQEKDAETFLFSVRPDFSANRKLTKGQKIVFCLLVVFLFFQENYISIGIITIFSTFIILKTIIVLSDIFISFKNLITQKKNITDIALFIDREWPVYTIFIPLYKEENMIPFLVKRLNALDYPKEKLDVHFIIERDDQQTIKTFQYQDFLFPVSIQVIPKGVIRTKPKAMATCLNDIQGEFIVIFDAEDRPEPLQLKKAVCHFRKSSEKVAALQAALLFYNPHTNLLTRLFALEYAMWFKQFLKGVVYLKWPVPFGGTSIHMRTNILKAIGGWDPYNVTEDCDLGMRLYRYGFRCELLDSETYEEATCHIWPWIRQRTRWIKGYFQTFLVHTRNPINAIRTMGLWPFIGMCSLLFATVALPILHIISFSLCCILILTAFFNNQYYDMIFNFYWLSISGIYQDYFIGFLIYGSFILPVLSGLTVLQKHKKAFALWGIGMWLYWVLMGISAFRALYEWVNNPFYWDKTTHGISRDEEEEILKKWFNFFPLPSLPHILSSIFDIKNPLKSKFQRK